MQSRYPNPADCWESQPESRCLSFFEPEMGSELIGVGGHVTEINVFQLFDMAAQLARVREMERNGELEPIPEISATQ